MINEGDNSLLMFRCKSIKLTQIKIKKPGGNHKHQKRARPWMSTEKGILLYIHRQHVNIENRRTLWIKNTHHIVLVNLFVMITAILIILMNCRFRSVFFINHVRPFSCKEQTLPQWPYCGVSLHSLVIKTKYACIVMK